MCCEWHCEGVICHFTDTRGPKEGLHEAKQAILEVVTGQKACLDTQSFLKVPVSRKSDSLLGLILVVVGGAELFTGNNLLAMAWTSRLVSTRSIIRN